METIERQHISIEDEMRRSYLDYAMSVIIGRALPDVRDGLSRCTGACSGPCTNSATLTTKPTRKSARVVGDVIGKYHRTAIRRVRHDGANGAGFLDALSANRWSGKLWFSGWDAPAAMRYTEVRMARLANEVLADIEKETVKYQPKLRRIAQRADGDADAYSNLLNQRLDGSRGHGHQDSAA